METEIKIDGPGILLLKETCIEYVMFLDWHKRLDEAKSDSDSSGRDLETES